ncbi:MAG: hypothetical protein ACKOAD_03965, partial [Gammaproteobacteria bacterium]
MSIPNNQAPLLHRGISIKSHLAQADSIGMPLRFSKILNQFSKIFGPCSFRATTVFDGDLPAQRSGEEIANKTGMTLSKSSPQGPQRGNIAAPQLFVDISEFWDHLPKAFKNTKLEPSELPKLIAYLKSQKEIFKDQDHLQTVQAMELWIKALETPEVTEPYETLIDAITETEIPKDDPNIKFTRFNPKENTYLGFDDKDRQHLIEHILEKEGNPKKIRATQAKESLLSIFIRANKGEYQDLIFDPLKNSLYFKIRNPKEQEFCLKLSDFDPNNPSSQIEPEAHPLTALSSLQTEIPRDIFRNINDTDQWLKAKEKLSQFFKHNKWSTMPIYQVSRNEAGQEVGKPQPIHVLSDYKNRPFFGDWDGLFQTFPLNLELPAWASTLLVNTFEGGSNGVKDLKTLTQALSKHLLHQLAAQDPEMNNLLESLVKDGFAHKIEDKFELDSAFFEPFMTARAGITTAYQFLVGQLMNYAYRGKLAFKDPTGNPKQHGNEVYNPYKPSSIDTISHHGPNGTEVTQSEEEALARYANSDFVSKFGLEINPKWGMDKWGSLVQEQINSALSNLDHAK